MRSAHPHMRSFRFSIMLTSTKDIKFLRFAEHDNDTVTKECNRSFKAGIDDQINKFKLEF